MRTRSQIEDIIEAMVSRYKGTDRHIDAGNSALILEVLLDIRDLLTSKKPEL